MGQSGGCAGEGRLGGKVVVVTGGGAGNRWRDGRGSPRSRARAW